MTVYVDDMQAPFGRYIMCHCWADTRDELFAMMDRIGVQRKWFQQPPKASWEHFDIALSKRALAVKFGAVETDCYGPVEHTAKLKIASGHPKLIVIGVRKLELVHKVRLKYDR